MSFGKVLVNFQGVGKLDGGFPVFALGAVLLSAFQVFMLSGVGIAEAPG
jgi:hypothetical protein